MRILITGACGVTSRSVVRSLKRSKQFHTSELIGSDVAENLYGLYEGLYERIYRVPWSSSDGYKKIIQDICGKERIDLAIVIPEPEVLFWSEHAMPVKALLPPPRFSRIAISKRKLYDVLRDTQLVPDFYIGLREQLLEGHEVELGGAPVWVRDSREGSTSGKGSFKAENVGELQAWVQLNPEIKEFMVSDYLPGRNFACCMLFYQGDLLKVSSYERLEYFMARNVPSGISGNISRGELVNDSRVRQVSERAVQLISSHVGETMHGLVTVDLREDKNDRPMVTEINLRHVACTSAFAEAGANMAEAQVFATIGELGAIGECEVQFPEHNLILRDIDGLPIWVREYREIGIGECISGSALSVGLTGMTK